MRRGVEADGLDVNVFDDIGLFGLTNPPSPWYGVTTTDHPGILSDRAKSQARACVILALDRD